MVLSMLNVHSAVRSKQSPKPSDRVPTQADTQKTPGEAFDSTTTNHVDAPDNDLGVADDTLLPATELQRPAPAPKRFSFRSMGFFRGGDKDIISPAQLDAEEHKVKDAAKYRYLTRNSGQLISQGIDDVMKVFARRADARAQKNALAMQKLIVGPNGTQLKKQNRGGNAEVGTHAGKTAPRVSRGDLMKIKSELMQPKAANRLIAKLRELPSANDDDADEDTPTGLKNDKKSDKAAKKVTKAGKSLPIHAVCLSEPEQHISATHFAKLDALCVSSASLSSLSTLFSSMQIVDLLTAPNLGLGAPGDAEGILAGAVPTAETIIRGAEKLTPQLMDLGYATGRAIVPDHSAVHPPTDRLSVLTYWWGLELCLPPPTLAHIAQVPSIAHEVINFLSALALMNDGVRECLPFVRYMGQFVDFEWKEIQASDEGRGVVCAATWIMPAALVPRPWDFPEAPAAVAPDAPASASPSAPEMKGPLATPNPGAAPQKQEEEKADVGTDIPHELPHPPAISPLPSLLVTPPSGFRESPSARSETAKEEATAAPSDSA